jgi:hypothetical protein
MIPREDFQRFLKSDEIDLTKEEVKQMNQENKFLEYIEKGAPVAVALPKAVSKKKIPSWLICAKQRRGVYGK